MVKYLFITLVLLFFIAVGLFYKPIRVITPTIFGMTCVNDIICVDDVTSIDRATVLYKEALMFVSSALSKPKTKPRMIFCASDDCNRTFGLGKKAAYALGKFGIVVSKRAWKPFYIRHEIIHHLQYETLGTFKVLLLTPAWFTEGMAYDLSEDPRTPLSEPFETARTEFKAWYSVQSKDSLWLAAAKL